MNKIVSVPTDATPIAPDVVDPVYAMIERHKELSVAYSKAVNHPDVGNSVRKNPAAERASNRAMKQLLDQARRLFAFKPSTAEGVEALLRYISSLKEWELPGDYSGESELRRLKQLTKSLAEALSDTKLSEALTIFSPSLDLNDDPIFDVISEHRQAVIAFDQSVQRKCDLQSELGVGSDDPRYIEADAAEDATNEAMHRSARALVGEPAQTVSGALALLDYFAEVTGRRMDLYEFPSDVEVESGRLSFSSAIAESVSIRLKTFLATGNGMSDDADLVASSEKAIAAYRTWSDLNSVQDDLEGQLRRAGRSKDELVRLHANTKRKADRAERVYMRLEEKISATHAHTPAGMYAKLRFLMAIDPVDSAEEIELTGGGLDAHMVKSILLDVERLATKAADCSN